MRTGMLALMLMLTVAIVSSGQVTIWTELLLRVGGG